MEGYLLVYKLALQLGNFFQYRKNITMRASCNVSKTFSNKSLAQSIQN
jgi:hypothetical protein